MNDFLFELGIEEVPVSEIRSISEQLKNKFLTKLNKWGITGQTNEIAATNRRFMIHIARLPEKTPDKEKQILGPSKNIAYNEEGKPALPLKKFLESHGITESDLVDIQTKKGDYIGVNKKAAGKKTVDILKEIIPDTLRELSFKKKMVWNQTRIPFIRPIRNLLCLFNNQLIDCHFAGIQSSNLIQGHTLLSAETLEIHSFKDYFEKLNRNFVIVREEERREKILGEIKEMQDDLEVEIDVDAELLEYYIYNNEYPVVFTGEFDRKYLELPQEIISTFMIKEKKLQPVYDRRQRLINTFIGISNIPDENKHVARGNEKVIQATLEDARFFWEKDIRDDFMQLRENLRNVVFQRDLGDYFDKTERLVKLVDFLAGETGKAHLADSLVKAARICKNDLTTRMVREFPSLQGIMGGLYLREAGMPDDVWKSVYGHYRPKGFSDEKLDHLGACYLSLCDKIDNITAFMKKGIKTSGSADPYGIRRDANAIIKTIIDKKMDFNLDELIRFSVGTFFAGREKTDDSQDIVGLQKRIKEYFVIRIATVFKDHLDMKADLVSAVMNSDALNIHLMHSRARDVSDMRHTDYIQDLIILHKRLKNIIRDFRVYNLSEDLMAEQEEKILFEIFKESKAKIEESILNHEYMKACSTLLEMKPVIDSFFDNILVMAEDEAVKKNRIALLQRIDELLSKIADFSILQE